MEALLNFVRTTIAANITANIVANVTASTTFHIRPATTGETLSKITIDVRTATVSIRRVVTKANNSFAQVTTLKFRLPSPR